MFVIAWYYIKHIGDMVVETQIMAENEIICGDCLEIIRDLPQAKMIFADPPDNLGLNYEGFKDKWPSDKEYIEWLVAVTHLGMRQSDIFWLSYYHKWDFQLKAELWQMGISGKGWQDRWSAKPYVWWYTFGQHNKHDNGSCFRPLLRFKKNPARIYPDAIREPSARQRKYNDKRANPAGRVPGDVWDGVWQESRVCGSFKEKRKWYLNQHPEALIERMIKLSCEPGDLVIDMFAGTGTVNRVCKRLGIDCIGIEISPFYCEQSNKDLFNVSPVTDK